MAAIPLHREEIDYPTSDGQPMAETSLHRRIVEVTSESTRDEDLSKKKRIYRRLGVEEYFLFDPYGDYLEPRLQGQRLEGGRYIPMAPKPDGSLVSSTTGLILRPEGERLRLVDSAAGPLLWIEEMEDELDRLRSELERKPRGG